MSQTSRVLDYLQSVSPGGATNSEIASALTIQPHQAVFKITQELKRKNRIRGERNGSAWTFFACTDAETATDAEEIAPSATFEALARRVMSVHHGTLLGPDTIPGVRKRFDFVSGDRTIVGDAKFYSLVNGTGMPPAKLSTIAEYVWLLEKTGAPVQFLVFGHDRAVPMMWLARYGSLASTVSFYFLKDDGTLEVLQEGDEQPAIRARE